MRTCVVFAVLWLLALPAFAELTPADINIITDIVKTENAASEKRLREYVDLKFETLDTKFTTKLNELDTKFTIKFEGVDKQFEGVDKQFEGVDKQFEAIEKRQNLVVMLVTGIIALVVLAIGIPQIILALRQKAQDNLMEEMKMLREKVELLEKSHIVK